MDKKFFIIRHFEAEGQPPMEDLTEKGCKRADDYFENGKLVIEQVWGK